MDDLSQALESFNRKERNLLVRAALGHKETPLKLGTEFRERVASKLGIGPISGDAWWATDFHISWLAGAFAIYYGDMTAVGETGRPNPIAQKSARRLVEGNQEDIDLVIAAGRNLILIEAKAFGAWSNAQMRSKLIHLELLRQYHDEIRVSHEHPINLHLLLTSLRAPEKLISAPAPWSKDGAMLPWVLLDSELKGPIRTVTRCNDKGDPSATGDRWRVLKSNSGVAGWRRELDPAEEGDLQELSLAISSDAVPLSATRSPSRSTAWDRTAVRGRT